MMQHAYDLNQWALPAPGDTIAGKYLVEGPCGRGRLAVVLSAIHAELDRRVALKVLRPDWAYDPEVVQRFIRQGLAARRIKSEHALRVLDVGMLMSAAPYLVIEFQEGRPLDDILAAGALPLQTAVDWVLQAAEAVAEAHACGIIHRNLKPANLFMTHRADGTAWIRVSDFGLPNVIRANNASSWKASRTTDARAWPHCMAPEQLRGTRDVGEAADLWALGAILFELVTAKAPFRAHSRTDLGTTILTKPPERVSSFRANVPAGLERAIGRCLEKEPELRFANVADFARALAPFGSAAANGSSERIQRFIAGPPPEVTPPVAFHRESVDEAGGDDTGVRVRRLSNPVSAKMIFGSLAVMAALGAGVFGVMYESVHHGDSAARQLIAESPPAPAPTPLVPLPMSSPSMSPPMPQPAQSEVTTPVPPLASAAVPAATPSPAVAVLSPARAPRSRVVHHVTRATAPVRSLPPRAEMQAPDPSDDADPTTARPAPPAPAAPDEVAAPSAPADHPGSDPVPTSSDPGGSAAFDSRK